ncbi:unnamed protein product [Effrenium voratum]|nr:unnamed protein product [Effrenium voratum]
MKFAEALTACEYRWSFFCRKRQPSDGAMSRPWVLTFCLCQGICFGWRPLEPVALNQVEAVARSRSDLESTWHLALSHTIRLKVWGTLRQEDGNMQSFPTGW